MEVALDFHFTGKHSEREVLYMVLGARTEDRALPRWPRLHVLLVTES